MMLSNRIAVITGANAGLGFATAANLIQLDATVVMACRNVEKAKIARDKLLKLTPNARVEMLPLDVSDPASIENFAKEYEKEVGKLDILINNAGVVMPSLVRNKMGHEMHLATNYFGAFILTGLMLPFFETQHTTRILNVGSLASRLWKFSFDDPNWERTKFNHWKAYARSKIATAGFTIELNRRLHQKGSKVIALSAHPGFANTEMGDKHGVMTPTNSISRWIHSARAFIPTPQQAAESITYAASTPDVTGGDYYGPSGLFEIRGKPGKARLNPVALDPTFGSALWDLSEQMTGYSYL